MNRLFHSLAIILLASISFASAAQMWTDNTGHFQVEADYIDADLTSVTLHLKDGPRIKVSLHRLSKPDYNFVVEQLRRKGLVDVEAYTPPIGFVENPFEYNVNAVHVPDEIPEVDFYDQLLDPERYSTDLIREASLVLPDKYKKNWFFPVVALIGAVLYALSGCLVILTAFRESLGWGIGQVLADLVSCVFVVTGIVFSIILLFRVGRESFGVVALKLIGTAFLIGSAFLIPSGSVPPPPPTAF